MSRKIIHLSEGDYIPTVVVVDSNGDPVVGSGGGGGGAVSVSDGADVTQGAKANTVGTWYDQVVSVVSLLKLLVAATVGAGSHVYGYTGTKMTTDAWTLFGTTRTKTFTYTGENLTGESDWV